MIQLAWQWIKRRRLSVILLFSIWALYTSIQAEQPGWIAAFAFLLGAWTGAWFMHVTSEPLARAHRYLLRQQKQKIKTLEQQLGVLQEDDDGGGDFA